MKRLLCLIAAIVFLANPSLAELDFQNLNINRSENEVNIRATLINHGPERIQGPISVTLEASPVGKSDWQVITQWDDISALPKGYRVSRDYFAAPDSQNASVLFGDFEVRATARSADGQRTEIYRTFP